MSSRKDVIRSHFEKLADSRDRWIARNSDYYAEDRRDAQFIIPEGMRVLELGCGTGDLLSQMKPSYGVGEDLSPQMIEVAKRNHRNFDCFVGDLEEEAFIAGLKGPFAYIVLSDTIGYLDDIELVFRALRKIASPHTRLVVSYYSHLWEPVLALAESVGRKMPQPGVNFLSSSDITNLLYLAGFEVVRTEWRQLIPKRLLGMGRLVNRYLGTLPLIRRLCLRHYIVARPFERRHDWAPSVSILIPCRNEKGNVESAITRMPRFAEDMEFLYVKGN